MLFYIFKEKMMKKFFILLLLCLVWSEASGVLVMVRADKDEEFLSSPEKMDLTNLRNTFNPNVETIVYIHGYLNDYSSAKDTYKEAVKDAKAIIGDRNYIGFHWPSQVIWFGTAVDNANKAGKYIAYALTEVHNLYGENPQKIHVICHSLGCRVILNTLSLPEAQNLPWGNICMMAPAVRSSAFRKEFPDTNLYAKNYIFHSTRDGVLKHLYSLYESLFGEDRTERNELIEWINKPVEEQLAYIEELDQKLQNGFQPTTELDYMLRNALAVSRKDAMGLNGAQAGANIINMNYRHFAHDHQDYWRSKIQNLIATELLGSVQDPHSYPSRNDDHGHSKSGCGFLGIEFVAILFCLSLYRKVSNTM